MNKHTPGPWRVRNCQTAVLVDVVRNGEAMLIALVADNDSRGDTETERKMNNAQLIAAAPQMLEALEACADYWHIKHNPGDEHGELLSLSAERAQRLIRVALAAAKGEV